MLRSAASKAMWVGRATAALIGLTIALAVVLGIASMALAAVPGDPFKLGKINSINRVSTLVGSVAGPLLKVDNNGGGPALKLEANSGKPPLVVNADAGTATNLDADKVDGLDSPALMRSSSYVHSESFPVADNGGASHLVYCTSSTDRVLSGGFSSNPRITIVNSSTPYVAPFDGRGQGWGVSAHDRVGGDGFSASVTVYVLCADFPPMHTS